MLESDGQLCLKSKAPLLETRAIECPDRCGANARTRRGGGGARRPQKRERTWATRVSKGRIQKKLQNMARDETRTPRGNCNLARNARAVHRSVAAAHRECERSRTESACGAPASESAQQAEVSLEITRLSAAVSERLASVRQAQFACTTALQCNAQTWGHTRFGENMRSGSDLHRSTKTAETRNANEMKWIKMH
jgi:hypothetical protein